MKKINKFKVTHGTISTGFRGATYILEEDVLEVIDEGCDQYDSKHPELTRCCGDILFNNTIWICPRCEELKKRITG